MLFVALILISLKGDFEVAHSSPRSCDSKLGLGSGSIVQRAFQPEHVQAEGQSILHFFNLFPSSSRQNLSKFWGAKFCDIFLNILCKFTKPGSYGGFAKGSFPVKLAKTSFRSVCPGNRFDATKKMKPRERMSANQVSLWAVVDSS